MTRAQARDKVKRNVVLLCEEEASTGQQGRPSKALAFDQAALIQLPDWLRIRGARLEHAVLVTVEDGGMAAAGALLREARLVALNHPQPT